MTVTTNEYGQQNMFAVEPAMYMTDEDRLKYGMESHNERAEKLNVVLLCLVLLQQSFPMQPLAVCSSLVPSAFDNGTDLLYNYEHCLLCTVGILSRTIIRNLLNT